MTSSSCRFLWPGDRKSGAGTHRSGHHLQKSATHQHPYNLRPKLSNKQRATRKASEHQARDVSARGRTDGVSLRLLMANIKSVCQARSLPCAAAPSGSPAPVAGDLCGEALGHTRKLPCCSWILVAPSPRPSQPPRRAQRRRSQSLGPKRGGSRPPPLWSNQLPQRMAPPTSIRSIGPSAQRTCQAHGLAEPLYRIGRPLNDL